MGKKGHFDIFLFVAILVLFNARYLREQAITNCLRLFAVERVHRKLRNVGTIIRLDADLCLGGEGLLKVNMRATEEVGRIL